MYMSINDKVMHTGEWDIIISSYSRSDWGIEGDIIGRVAT